MKKLTAAILFLLFGGSLICAQEITDLFSVPADKARRYTTAVAAYQPLEIKAERLAYLRRQPLDNMTLTIPSAEKSLRLRLKKATITSGDFSVVEILPGGAQRTTAYSGGTFYQGSIEGDASSFATLSIFDDHVAAVIADKEGNIVLSSLEGDKGRKTESYVLYRENDLLIKNPFKCYTEDGDTRLEAPVSGNNQSLQHGNAARGNMTGEPIDIYFECAYDLYQKAGNNTNSLINYVLGFFNSVQYLYAVEDIHVQVSQIKVWTTLDPYSTYTETLDILEKFRDNMNASGFNGDFAHFISNRFNGGGIAYRSAAPCNLERGYRTGVSMINTSYSSFPTTPYSWTIQVVTHELGHNFGSHHTQWCGWTGGALDNCYDTEPTTTGGTPCPPGPAPQNGGTIMSYCHLRATGINFNNGFGQQPGNRIRAIVGSSNCFAACKMTISLAIQDASCNQNNGTATVTATNSTGALTYLWSNGQTTATLSGAAPGTYHVTVRDASGCQVMEDVVIGNSGTELVLDMNNPATAGFCAGGSVILSVTNNPAYTYQWSRNGTPVNGATAASYEATTAGNYSVTAVSGICSATKTVQVVQVAAPTATITAGSATTFCGGGSVVLNASAGTGYSYQWYKNSTIITGAVADSYTATESGSYTVKVSAGSACEVTSAATVVTVNTTPLAAITAGGALTFCSGGTLTLTASNAAGYTHQWYNGASPINGATQPALDVTASGSYSVRTTLGPCSATSATSTVTVLPTPVVSITPASSVIQKFDMQTLAGSGASSYNWSAHPAYVNSTFTTGSYRPLTTTTYTIEGTASNGCKSTATATIIVNGCGPVTEQSATAYSPSRAMLRWSNPEASTSDTIQYRKQGATTWTRIFIGNVTPQTLTEYELNGLEPGTTYEYNIIPLCTTTSTFIPSATQTFSTPGLGGDFYTRLFPNPASGSTRLEVIGAGSFTMQVAIYDYAGKQIRIVTPAQSLPAGQIIIPVSTTALSNGVYHVVAELNGKRISHKLVVAH